MRVLALSILLLAGCAVPFSHVGNNYDAAVRVEVGSGHGSGVVVAKGVLTAAHVIEGKDEYTIHGDGWSVTGSDILIMGEGYTDTDWALLDVETGIEPAPVYCGPLELGQEVVLVGNPGIAMGFIRTVTYGRVSSLDIGDYGDMFSHTVGLDISAAPGTSGGPVYSMDGEVVGLLVGGAPHAHMVMVTALMTRLPEEVC